MLFLLGLDIQPRRLWSMRRLVFGLGSAEYLTCVCDCGIFGGRRNGSHQLVDEARRALVGIAKQPTSLGETA